MKLKVVQKFRDKYDGRTLYSEGTIIEIEDDARAQDLIFRKLCVADPATHRTRTTTQSTEKTGGSGEPDGKKDVGKAAAEHQEAPKTEEAPVEGAQEGEGAETKEEQQ